MRRKGAQIAAAEARVNTEKQARLAAEVQAKEARARADREVAAARAAAAAAEARAAVAEQRSQQGQRAGATEGVAAVLDARQPAQAPLLPAGPPQQAPQQAQQPDRAFLLPPPQPAALAHAYTAPAAPAPAAAPAAAAAVAAAPAAAAALLVVGLPPEPALLPPVAHSGPQPRLHSKSTSGLRGLGRGSALGSQPAARGQGEPPSKRQRTFKQPRPRRIVPALDEQMQDAWGGGDGGGEAAAAGTSHAGGGGPLPVKGAVVVKQERREQGWDEDKAGTPPPPQQQQGDMATAAGTAAATAAAAEGAEAAAMVAVPSQAGAREEAAASPRGPLAASPQLQLAVPGPPLHGAAANTLAPAPAADQQAIAADTHGTAAGEVAGAGGSGSSGDGQELSVQHGGSALVLPAAAAPPAAAQSPMPLLLLSPAPAELQIHCPRVKTVSVLQQRLQEWAAKRWGPGVQPLRTFVVDLGGAELAQGPRDLEQRTLSIPGGVSVVICNGGLPVPVEVESCAGAEAESCAGAEADSCRHVALKRLDMKAVLWQNIEGSWQQVARGVVTATGAKTRVVVDECRLVVARAEAAAAATPTNRPVRSCRTASGPPLVRGGTKYFQSGVVAAEGARVLVRDCSITGPYSLELQREWAGSRNPLDCTGVFADGAGSQAVALRTRAEDCTKGFAACRGGMADAYGCVAQSCGNGFDVKTGSRMRCGHVASAAAAAATAAVLGTGAGNAGGAGSSNGGAGGTGGGCRASDVLFYGFAAYESAEMELLDGCSSERCEGAGCLARCGVLQATGFTSVVDGYGFWVTKPGASMQLQAGCVARGSTAQGFVAQDGARMQIGPPAEAAAAEDMSTALVVTGAGGAGAGVERPWDARAEGCRQEGFLAVEGELVLRPGARVAAVDCAADGFVAADGGKLDAAAASECLAQGCQKSGFGVEGAKSTLALGSSVCRAVGNKEGGVAVKEGGVVQGQLAEA
ncbi:hypothetical protein CHLRE_01g023450v5 [Chlamydomonas reinhardtii]|uniref:Uncharacterized protein n=1 Tax=Chlamydomonas reinhardtii TaxID=3055 RepID=A0A2K3E6B4_CHLRE|nr:uncharacterized protein CHLRE_01g023450v5 [Chlamydomonas reinhardtii]PNW88303.1 hypothetical protein CHLRE_01g023450v5 [Chlamydomonas reinhardtii]